MYDDMVCKWWTHGDVPHATQQRTRCGSTKWNQGRISVIHLGENQTRDVSVRQIQKINLQSIHDLAHEMHVRYKRVYKGDTKILENGISW